MVFDRWDDFGFDCQGGLEQLGQSVWSISNRFTEDMVQCQCLQIFYRATEIVSFDCEDNGVAGHEAIDLKAPVWGGCREPDHHSMPEALPRCLCNRP